MSDSAAEARLLIVNHDRDMNLNAEVVLWLNGYEPETVESIAEANKRLESERYALLVCRNAMPDGAGPELMRKAWAENHIPSVAITQTLSKAQMRARVACDGLREVIVLPATQNTLLKAVAKALGRSDVGPAYRDYVQATAMVPCRDCRGSGSVTLLIHRKKCTTCDGTGSIVPDLVDLPIRHTWMPGLIRFSLNRAGIKTLREASKLNSEELKRRAHLSDSDIAAIAKFTRSTDLDQPFNCSHP